MKQKEERDLENALNWDGKPPDFKEVLEATRIDNEESERFFREAGQTLVKGNDPVLLEHRRKRVGSNLAKHWFIYEYPSSKEVRLLTSKQHINGEKYSFMNGEDKPIFSYG
jgi:hypothetical protein